MAQIRYLLLVIAISVPIAICTECAYKQCTSPWNPAEVFEHTMCLYSATEFGANCSDVRSSSLSDKDQKEILDVHNVLRAKVAAGKETRGPNGGQPAGIIGPLVWDDELALIAQRWANQCTFEHDTCKNIGDVEVGQNIGYQGSSGLFNNTYVDIVTAWYNEVVKFDSELVPNYQFTGELTAHYVQLIWANTTHVGCGGIKHITPDDQHYVRLVCNYSPKGNWIGEALYKVGDKSAVNPPNESDLEPPPELADEPSDQPDLSTLENTPSPPTLRNIAGAVPWRSHSKSPPDQYMREVRSHNPMQPALHVPRFESHPRQACEYAACRNPEAPGQYKEHTMCQYPDNNLGGQCTNVQKSYLDPTEINDILSIHNEERRQLTAPASLQWNTELADIAQRWANQCQYYKDECRNIHGIEVQQNLGEMGNVGDFTPFSNIVKAWYSAMKNYNYDYPNLMWTNTTDVGCGGVQYINSDGNLKSFLVCNYMSNKNVHPRAVGTAIKPRTRAFPIINADVGSECQYNRCEDPRVRGKYVEHTMCRYTHPNTAAECNKVRQSFLSALDQQQILHAHNTIREQSGHNIRALRWNDQLATVAQRWASQCRVGNDVCRDLDHTSHVGQNFGMLGWKHEFLYGFYDVVTSWDAQRSLRNAKSRSGHVSNTAQGSYLQIISSDTTDVGCGGVKYVDAQGYHNTYLVCNYSPSGTHHVQYAHDVHGALGAESWLR